MTDFAIVKDSLKRIASTGWPQYPLLCEVLAVNDDYTIDVKPKDSIEYFGIRLKASTQDESGTIILPAVGSDVCIQLLDRSTGYVTLFSEITSKKTTIGDCTHELTEDGLKLSVGSNDFKTGLSDLKTALEQMTVNTPNGPSSVPVNLSAITAAFNKILGTLQ